MGLFTWIKGLGRRAFNPPCGSGEITRAQWDAMRTAFPKPPTKPQPTGGRLIHVDRDPGPVNQSAPVPAEMPSDEHTCHTSALLAFAEGRRQAQALQLPPPGADPVATTENLWDLFTSSLSADSGASHADARRAIYERGRADERAAITKALGAEP